MSILRILHENKLHSYHIHLHQNLKELDFVSRVNFYNIMFRMINEDPTFLLRVLFSDEANFCNNEQVNRHMHYWTMKNPYWMRTIPFQHLAFCTWSLNVWCDIMGNHIVRPHFFEESLNCHCCFVLGIDCNKFTVSLLST